MGLNEQHHLTNVNCFFLGSALLPCLAGAGPLDIGRDLNATCTFTTRAIGWTAVRCRVLAPQQSIVDNLEVRSLKARVSRPQFA